MLIFQYPFAIEYDCESSVDVARKSLVTTTNDLFIIIEGDNKE